MARPTFVRSSFFAIASVALFATSHASANDLIKDGTELSIDLTESSLCFVRPIELRNAAACVDLSPDDEPPNAPTAREHELAMALKKMPNGDVLRVSVVVSTNDRVGTPNVTAATASREVDDMARGLKGALPAGAAVKATNARVVDCHGAPALRGTLTVSGVAPDLAAKLEHMELVTLMSTRATYAVRAFGPATSRESVDAIVDVAAKTASLTSPAPREAPKSVYYEAAKLSFYGLLAIVLVWTLRNRLRRAKPKSNE